MSQKYVTKSLLKEALTTYFQNESINVLNFTTSSVTDDGDNFTSELFRLVVDYKDGNGKTNQISLIIKCEPNDDRPLAKMIKEKCLFEKEVTFYTEIMPVLQKMFDKLNDITPTCIYAKPDYSTLILEDLQPLGYKMKSRYQGLDSKHCFSVLKNMAYFHATSAIYSEQNPLVVTKYHQSIYDEKDMSSQWISIGYESLINACSQWPGYQKYSYKLRTIHPSVIQRTLAAVKPLKDGFNSINHGDTWINNFLFQYSDAGALKNMKLVDFQQMIFCSPVIDLHLFWSTSPNLSVREKGFDELFNYYYKILSNTLRELNYPAKRIPTKKELQQEFDDNAIYGLTVSVTILPFILSKWDSDPITDFLTKDGEGSFREFAYNQMSYKNHMEYILPAMDSFGVMN